jgi:hypothetical protein
MSRIVIAGGETIYFFLKGREQCSGPVILSYGSVSRL